MQQFAEATARASTRLKEHFETVKNLPAERVVIFAKTLMMSFEDRKISAEDLTYIALCMADHFKGRGRLPAIDLLMAAYKAGHVPALAGIYLLREQKDNERYPRMLH